MTWKEFEFHKERWHLASNGPHYFSVHIGDTWAGACVTCEVMIETFHWRHYNGWTWPGSQAKNRSSTDSGDHWRKKILNHERTEKHKYQDQLERLS